MGTHLINLEAIAHVKLTKGGAELLLQGPRKSLQTLRVPGSAGEELWWFMQDRMVVAEFGNKPEPSLDAKAKSETKAKSKSKSKRKSKPKINGTAKTTPAPVAS